jgi:hypothetical protein
MGRQDCDINATLTVIKMQQSRKCDIFTTLMKFIYNIKDEQGNQKTLKAMSYKKLLKQLNNKFKEGEVIQVKYKNKKDHDLLKYIKIEKVE